MEISKNLILTCIKENLQNLKLSNKIYERCKKTLDNITDEDKIEVPFNVITVSAGLIFVTAILEGEKRTQREIGYCMNITEASIRKFAKHLEGIENHKKKV